MLVEVVGSSVCLTLQEGQLIEAFWPDVNAMKGEGEPISFGEIMIYWGIKGCALHWCPVGWMIFLLKDFPYKL